MRSNERNPPGVPSRAAPRGVTARPGPAGDQPHGEQDAACLWSRQSVGTDPDQVISAYLAAWNTADDTHRRRHLLASWSASGSFEDPLVRLEGRRAMNAHIAACRAAQPDVRWSVTSDIEHHHGRILFAWQAIDGNARVIVAGHSFGELNSRGRIRRLVGLFSSRAS